MSFDWSGRPCLVTGAAGFGGAHLCALLLGRGARVFALDRAFPRSAPLALLGQADKVETISGDIRDLDLVGLAAERFEIDTVFHLAAQPLVPVSNSHPLETLSVNALGTYAMLEAARRSRAVKRFVFASSGAYYGTTATEDAIGEDDAPVVSANIYGPSKVAGDAAVRSYAKVFGLKAGICRFMNTYGPGDTNWSRLVPRAIKNVFTGGPYDFGDRDDGSAQLDFLYVGDMARAYLAVAEKVDEHPGEAFNFGSGKPTAIRDVALAVSRLADDRTRQPIFRGKPVARPIKKFLDIAKARAVLGWEPATSLDSGLQRTIDWYRRSWEQL
ncbi:MAG: NAD-dependent epimerase/dehydratase family protein [Planctomycetota bacterium]